MILMHPPVVFCRNVVLPLHWFGQNVAVSCVIGSESVAAILHTEHHERFRTIVAHRTLACRSHAHHTTLLNREDFAVDLKLTAAFKEKIKLLMILMGMQETGLLTRSENLKRKFAACRTERRSTEHLSGNPDFRAEFKHIVLDVSELAEIYSTVIFRFREILNLFHRNV